VFCLAVRTNTGFFFPYAALTVYYFIKGRGHVYCAERPKSLNKIQFIFLLKMLVVEVPLGS
jgi:hypothetical protein